MIAGGRVMRRLWRWFLAYCRLNDEAVCEMSRGLPEDRDYHDWPDGDLQAPWHMATHHCTRCGKAFTI